MGVSNESEARQIAQVVYILQAVSLVIGLTALVGVIINHVKLPVARGTWVESHFDWQIRTFWYTLLGAIVGAVLSVVGIGILVLLGVAVWYIYRVVMGWLAFARNEPIGVKLTQGA